MNRSLLTTAVWFDLDSCLADTRHRWHLSPSVDPSSSWEKYCAARMGDTPIPGTAAAARLHYQHHQVHIFSGSEESSGLVTREWLDLHKIPFDRLRQRPEGDRRANTEIKIGYIRELHLAGVEVVLGFEDHPAVAAEVCERTGVPVVLVNPGYPEDAHKFQQQAFDGMGGGL